MWEIKCFDKLSAKEIHDMYQLRSEVFVVEQQCIFQDIDGNDFKAIHVFKYDEKELIAYGRIFISDAENANARVGRVVVRAGYRGKGFAKALINVIIDWIEKNSTQSFSSVKISAQHNLINFYADFGFKVIGEPYDEDGILHVDMLRQ